MTLGATATYGEANEQSAVARPTVGAVGTAQMEDQWAELGQAYTMNESRPLDFGRVERAAAASGGGSSLLDKVKEQSPLGGLF